ncbi:hypothetical protein BXZ70DRAFT_101594 [Cristinia sonorae]|uniref:F-box domain-containing protein n=1 Tax=Cristinia sonorae TaxID=1940300 RepID=A0A8K0URE0_9AGAR|nr:hypothetical protein BXZ70DRAFT_101594 [Cristinia sonorae]
MPAVTVALANPFSALHLSTNICLALYTIEMGQYWVIFNIDKQCEEGGGGKLGEFLLSSGFQILNSLLLRSSLTVVKTPRTIFVHDIRPPREYAFAVFAFHRQVTETFLSRAGFSEADSRDDVRRDAALFAFLSPNAPMPCPSIRTRTHTYFEPKLLALPVELLVMIFQALEDTFSIVALSLTCELCFSLGYSRILARLKELAYSNLAVGDRLICVGDYATLDDLPAGVFSRAEKDEMDTWKSSDEELYSFLQKKREKSIFQRTLYDPSFWRKAIKAKLIDRPFAEQARLLKLLHVESVHEEDQTLLNTHGRYLALCNLTSGEFVRGNSFSLLYEGARPKLRSSLEKKYELDTPPNRVVPFHERQLGFGEVLASRICWSQDDSLAMVDTSGRLHRGPWAGHRFEITLADAKPCLEVGKVWKDVSEEVMREMRELWQGNFGDQWQEYI